MAFVSSPFSIESRVGVRVRVRVRVRVVFRDRRHHIRALQGYCYSTVFTVASQKKGEVDELHLGCGWKGGRAAC